ncbi:MAG: hypothetical protein IPO82_14425 [Betaproteobacteria bacterium]|nr:hypothetical protein [Betaproteobacteria bacterium]
MGFSKNVLSGAAVAAAFALSATVVPMATAAGNSSATGGGTTEEAGATSTFVFNAVQRKNGDVTGHLVYHVRGWPVTIMMDLDCLIVEGNTAKMSGVVTQVSEEYPGLIFVGQDATFMVEDNGQGANAGPDMFSDLFLEPGASCDDPRLGTDPFVPYLPVRGNIQVR